KAVPLGAPQYRSLKEAGMRTPRWLQPARRAELLSRWKPRTFSPGSGFFRTRENRGSDGSRASAPDLGQLICRLLAENFRGEINRQPRVILEARSVRRRIYAGNKCAAAGVPSRRGIGFCA